MKITDLKMIAPPLVNYKWNKFYAYPNANKNRRTPPNDKYVLVKLKPILDGYTSPILVGYLTYHAGVKSEPYFVIPGTAFAPYCDDCVIEWCDCLSKECQEILWKK
jgi:hypothetical protein